MKKYLWILAAAFLLQACSKDEEEGPYVPWRPGDDKEETIDLDKAGCATLWSSRPMASRP